MEKMNLVLMAVAVALVLMAGVQAIQLSELKAGGGASVAASAASSGAIDQSSWTEDEKMMYEHHGTLPARLSAQSAQPASSGMVGGC